MNTNNANNVVYENGYACIIAITVMFVSINMIIIVFYSGSVLDRLIINIICHSYGLFCTAVYFKLGLIMDWLGNIFGLMKRVFNTWNGDSFS